jgi:peroxiredoxin
LRAYQGILPRIQGLGASLAAISPQSPDQSQATLLKNFLQYEVLSDLGNGVARQYGLVYPIGSEMRRVYTEHLGIDLTAYNLDDSWELPLPGTFVVDSDLTVRLAFVDVDYTRRLDPAEILAALGTLT